MPAKWIEPRTTATEEGVHLILVLSLFESFGFVPPPPFSFLGVPIQQPEKGEGGCLYGSQSRQSLLDIEWTLVPEDRPAHKWVAIAIGLQVTPSSKCWRRVIYDGNLCGGRLTRCLSDPPPPPKQKTNKNHSSICCGRKVNKGAWRGRRERLAIYYMKEERGRNNIGAYTLRLKTTSGGQVDK